ncbi:transcription initiation factor TFIID family protein [Entamoeba histolytica HM-1:IMSS-B]|uniref:TATA-box-binding protein-like 1 n=7 Tax=Entamoeba TaxID=5758 RepID=TBPL1_ENTH1|nr:transcription initiation factor TFIID family protein [Entamoeba nuttalli P19]XP_654935.1 TATA binding protein, putative [Entamoeba histolytica HM-1:IMSS]A7UFC2.1 RecName: Full=TATA-box-binding protein-like 1; Short=EhTRF1 [Entamoeba histolytica HM-1:IMSS]ABS89251.1 TBP-related factor [Entamoeba histolytica]EMD43751.1 TBPrelated factor, putative [Entamoeba histolytica KU27]EMH73733.1 transcription initiation factor TFIID family protein [Entamoeba histolytica HM-1:IMSS-B]ENY61750.1 TBP-relat|eukprot:XP_008857000.1 transcription initiation factor TFIID family protein [Entamoeba nuttalli P19]
MSSQSSPISLTNNDLEISSNNNKPIIKQLPVPTNEIEKPVIQNIVATVELDCTINLQDVVRRVRNAEYNPKRFGALIIRITNPKTTALVFHSGKLVVTGGKTVDDSRLAGRKYARILQRLGYNVKFNHFKIQNVVASCDMKFAISLKELIQLAPKITKYEPEIFPGVVYRLADPKMVLLIFASGKIVFTGGKEIEQINKAFSEIYKILLQVANNDN